MFNIITPLVRFENIELIIENLKKQTDVVLHIITDDDDNRPLPSIIYQPSIYQHLIYHYICPNTNIDFWARCNNSINWLIDNQTINDEEYYCILNDDDLYEDNFFESLKNGILQANTKLSEKITMSDCKMSNIDLIVTSMKRGHNIPPEATGFRRHPTNTLFADPTNMTVGNVGVEQFFIKGKYLRNHKLPLTVHGDGELISDLVKKYQTLYLRDIYVLFNYLEPGRWNKN
jgi:hypothetical protein